MLLIFLYQLIIFQSFMYVPNFNLGANELKSAKKWAEKLFLDFLDFLLISNILKLVNFIFYKDSNGASYIMTSYRTRIRIEL